MGNPWAETQYIKFGMASPAKRALVQSDEVMGRHTTTTPSKSTAMQKKRIQWAVEYLARTARQCKAAAKHSKKWSTEGQTIVSKGRTLAEESNVRKTTGKEV